MQVYTHQLGHNFTLNQAGSVNCGALVVGTCCSAAEYGDPFDTMGNIAPMHYNSAQKSRVGWLPALSVVTHSGGSATYSLSPIESAGASTYAVTGTVSFTADGSGFCTVALINSAAQCTSKSLAAGTHGVVATYSGDTANTTSTSPTISEVVAAIIDTTPPVVTIASPANGATVVGMVTIGAKATDNVAVAGITLSVDGTVRCHNEHGLPFLQVEQQEGS